MFKHACDQDGILTWRQFTSCIQYAALGFAGVLRRLFRLFDKGGDQMVDFREFSCGLALLCKARRDQHIQLAFSAFDHDNDGLVGLQELSSFLVAFFRCVSFPVFREITLVLPAPVPC